jgi:hypothetical protein
MFHRPVDKKTVHPRAAASSRRATLPCVNERAPPASVESIPLGAQALRCLARSIPATLRGTGNGPWRR